MHFDQSAAELLDALYPPGCSRSTVEQGVSRLLGMYLGSRRSPRQALRRQPSIPRRRRWSADTSLTLLQAPPIDREGMRRELLSHCSAKPGQRFIAGLAAPYDRWSSGVTSQGFLYVHKGAFASTLAGRHHVELCISHRRQRHPIASTRDGSLRLLDLPEGLGFLVRIDPRDRTLLDLFDLVRQAKIDQASVCLSPERFLRTVRGLRVYESRLEEISLTTAGAFSETVLTAIGPPRQDLHDLRLRNGRDLTLGLATPSTARR